LRVGVVADSVHLFVPIFPCHGDQSALEYGDLEEGNCVTDTSAHCERW
jgi:hypothetical protein